MASLTFTAATTVAALKSEFNTAFGATLRIYNGGKVADDSVTLGELGLSADGPFEYRSSLTVDSFIERMKSEHNLKVKVYTCDGWVAVLGGLTLESAGKVKKNAVKADMESMIAYQRTDKSESEDHNNTPSSTNIHKTDFEFVVDGYTFYVDSNSAVWVINIPQNSRCVTIPESVNYKGDNYTITKIGVDLEDADFVENDEKDDDIIDYEGDNDNNAFYDNSNITSVQFPNTIDFIGAETIMNCPNIKLVGIGNGIKKIETNAISECDSLERVIIFAGKDDVSISKTAFQNNRSDTKVLFVKNKVHPANG